MVYSDEIEDKIHQIMLELKHCYPNLINYRWHALKLLEGDTPMQSCWSPAKTPAKKILNPVIAKKICARIATGDYDAVIIGHSQFEKIPLSAERQERLIQEQMDEIEEAIEEAKAQVGEHFTVKQLEKLRKSLKQKLEKLQGADRKDDVVTFEQLGVDRLFVDESQAFKNLYLYTKMRNVAGLSTSEAQKSSDMFGKCRYLDEITGGRGVIFATGTPPEQQYDRDVHPHALPSVQHLAAERADPF